MPLHKKNYNLSKSMSAKQVCKKQLRKASMLYHTEIGCALLLEAFCPLPVIANNITASLGIEEMSCMAKLNK